MGYIYKIWNDVNEKVYIGKTCLSVEERFRQHLNDAYRHCEEQRPLYSAIKKYGEEHFFVEKLEDCEDNLLGERECYWISYFDSYKNGYNATMGGDGKILFDHDLILEELLFCPYANLVAKKVGCCTDTVKEVARKHHIVLRSISRETMKDTTSKQICCEDDEHFFRFDSVADGAIWLHNIGRIKTVNSGVRSHISECARGIRKTAYGFTWYYC